MSGDHQGRHPRQQILSDSGRVGKQDNYRAFSGIKGKYGQESSLPKPSASIPGTGGSTKLQADIFSVYPTY
jgi:hypothetical protein